MMKDLYITKQYKKDLNTIRSNPNFDEVEFNDIVSCLRNGNKLHEKYKDHKLNNSKHYKNVKEFHLRPDILVIYKINKTELILMRIGSHSKLGLSEAYDNKQRTNIFSIC